MAGSVDEALRAYQQALELRPDYALAHNNLGAILFQRGELDQAGIHLREAVRLDPKNADALDNLGRLNQRLGDPRSARERFEQALAVRPDWPLAMIDLAWILAASPEPGATNPKRALDLAQQAVTLTGRRDIVALDALAGALAATSDFDRAIAVVDEALKIVPSGQAADVLRQRQARYRQHIPPTLP
jgi:tetratricopeptide (TPR) repeat protein